MVVRSQTGPQQQRIYAVSLLPWWEVTVQRLQGVEGSH